jgi:glutathionylspermidine synthase
VDRGLVNHRADQFNALQELLIARFAALGAAYPDMDLHVSCCRDTVEDRGTVQYAPNRPA